MRARARQKAGETQPRPPDPDREAAQAGLDLSMLHDNLALPVAERLRRHDIALIAAKEAMNRPRDRETIRQLQNIKRLRRDAPPSS